MILIKRTNSNDSDFHVLVEELDKTFTAIYGDVQLEYDQYNIIENIDTVVIAYTNNEPVGCGCFKKFNVNAVELKRMFVAADCRGKGIGAAILYELESWAVELGNSTIVLETGTKQTEAIHLYQKMGYQSIPNYGQYIGMKYSICMKKEL